MGGAGRELEIVVGLSHGLGGRVGGERDAQVEAVWDDHHKVIFRVKAITLSTLFVRLSCEQQVSQGKVM